MLSDIEVQKMKKAVESLMAANEEKVPSETQILRFVCALQHPGWSTQTLTYL
jgi:hypothetical protein